jgi:hypothetical protein
MTRRRFSRFYVTLLTVVKLLHGELGKHVVQTFAAPLHAFLRPCYQLVVIISCFVVNRVVLVIYRNLQL